MGTDRQDREIALTKAPRRSECAADAPVQARRRIVAPGMVGCMVMLDKSPAGIDRLEKLFGFEAWQLRTPLTEYALSGRPYGLDNGCFSGRLPDRWPRLIRQCREFPPLWATAPDVVGSARRTLELWPRFARAMVGVPRALVLQDGIGDFDIPWDELACVFVGGTDAFKSSAEARAAAVTGKMLGKWVHVGRVNTPLRAAEWVDIADSIDGSGLSRYDHMLEAVLDVLRNGKAALKKQKSKAKSKNEVDTGGQQALALGGEID